MFTQVSTTRQLSGSAIYGVKMPVMRAYLAILKDETGVDRPTDRPDIIRANTEATLQFQRKLEALMKARKMDKQLGRIQPMGAVRALTILATPAVADIVRMQPEVDTLTEHHNEIH